MNSVRILGVDPRCLCTAKLRAPAPLPYVSRRALKRVRDRIDPPKACNCCGAAVRLVSNAEIYHGREYGEWPYAYLCTGCRAYVGLHPDTDLPLGILADKDTREARKDAKAIFYDLVLPRFHGDRNKAYGWLAGAMGIDRRECHFGLFDAARCDQAIAAMVPEEATRSVS
jgi:hypothetical protein